MNLVLGALAWAISAAWVAATTSLLWTLLLPRHHSLRLASFVMLSIFVVTGSQLLAGLLGLLRPLPLGVLSAAGLVAIWALPPTRALLRTAAGEMKRTGRAAVDAWDALPAWLRALSLVLIPLLVIRAAFLVWALPPFVWDSLTYHLPNVAAWTQAGRIYTVESPVDRMMSPANFEVYATWFTTFLHHDLFVEAAGLPAYALGIVSAYALGRVVGLAQWSSWVAALGFATTPALLLASTGTKNDPIMAALFLFLLALGWEAASSYRMQSERVPLEEIVLASTAVGLGLGTKAYIVQMVVGVAAVVIILGRGGVRRPAGEVWKAARATWSRWGRTGKLLVGACVLMSLVLAGLWYVRNWVMTGNPLYPYGVQIGASTILPRSSDAARVTWQDFATNAESLVVRLGDKRQRILPDLPETTGWGWVAYGLGVPALAWGLVRSRRQRILSIGFALALVLVVQASPTAAWMTRFLAWVPALLCLAAAEAIQELGQASRWLRLGFAGLFVVGCFLNVSSVLSYANVSPEDMLTMLRLPALDRDAARLEVTVPEEYARALEIVPREDVLGYNVHGNGFIYPLYRADYSQRLAYVPIPAGSTCESIADAVEARGSRTLFVAPEHTEDWILNLLNACATEKKVIRERVRGLYVVKRQ